MVATSEHNRRSLHLVGHRFVSGSSRPHMDAGSVRTLLPTEDLPQENRSKLHVIPKCLRHQLIITDEPRLDLPNCLRQVLQFFHRQVSFISEI